ncbi:MAG: hypothetical protein M3Z24_10525 [Chloroflexota bacterium]|nr:hypothetical protein [Chloroflexota bacterium]
MGGALLLLIGGIYMTTTHWGWGTAWILVALLTLLMQAALAGAVHTLASKPFMRLPWHLRRPQALFQQRLSAGSVIPFYGFRCRLMESQHWELSF